MGWVTLKGRPEPGMLGSAGCGEMVLPQQSGLILRALWQEAAGSGGLVFLGA